MENNTQRAKEFLAAHNLYVPGIGLKRSLTGIELAELMSDFAAKEAQGFAVWKDKNGWYWDKKLNKFKKCSRFDPVKVQTYYSYKTTAELYELYQQYLREGKK